MKQLLLAVLVLLMSLFATPVEAVSVVETSTQVVEKIETENTTIIITRVAPSPVIEDTTVFGMILDNLFEILVAFGVICISVASLLLAFVVYKITDIVFTIVFNCIESAFPAKEYYELPLFTKEEIDAAAKALREAEEELRERRISKDRKLPNTLTEPITVKDSDRDKLFIAPNVGNNTNSFTKEEKDSAARSLRKEK